ncbi:hypothetical protein [Mycolicibacterium vanbaalenii]|uniref:hypothetical protein n=1 Tax=Mycolicibacterium vanbaalenii TaxID=110539 RepID=UPI0023BA7771|nr:hypothetical protein [Mycolicibacterium vanbaalenii]
MTVSELRLDKEGRSASRVIAADRDEPARGGNSSAAEPATLVIPSDLDGDSVGRLAYLLGEVGGNIPIFALFVRNGSAEDPNAGLLIGNGGTGAAGVAGGTGGFLFGNGGGRAVPGPTAGGGGCWAVAATEATPPRRTRWPVTVAAAAGSPATAVTAATDSPTPVSGCRAPADVEATPACWAGRVAAGAPAAARQPRSATPSPGAPVVAAETPGSSAPEAGGGAGGVARDTRANSGSETVIVEGGAGGQGGDSVLNAGVGGAGGAAYTSGDDKAGDLAVGGPGGAGGSAQRVVVVAGAARAATRRRDRG